MREFVQRRLLQPIKQLLVQGITPEKVALSLALGSMIAVFPVLGSTTLLCAAAAVLLRLNLPTIQLLNYLLYPVQLALLVPFMRAGASLFHTSPLPFSLAQMLMMFRENWWHTLSLLWVAALQAIAVWTLCAPLVIGVLYWTLLPLLTRVARTIPASQEQS